MRSVTDDARAEVERNDERQGVLRVARERAPLVRREGVADVARQPERPDRGRVAEERREALPERARVCATMHEPRDGVPADVSAQDFEDGDQGGRDAGEGAILPQEPAREAEEPEEEERPDEPRAMRGRRRGWRARRGRGGVAPEVEGDDHHDRVDDDGGDGGTQDEQVAVRRGDEDRNAAADASTREAERLGKLCWERSGQRSAQPGARLKHADGKVRGARRPGRVAGSIRARRSGAGPAGSHPGRDAPAGRLGGASPDLARRAETARGPEASEPRRTGPADRGNSHRADRPPPDPGIGPPDDGLPDHRTSFRRRVHVVRAILCNLSVSLVPTHVWLMETVVNKASVLVMETLINIDKYPLLRGDHEGVQDDQRPGGVPAARGRDPAARDLPAASERDDREPDRGGAQHDAPGDLPPHPQDARCGPRGGRPRGTGGSFHRDVLSSDRGDLQLLPRRGDVPRGRRGEGRGDPEGARSDRVPREGGPSIRVPVRRSGETDESNRREGGARRVDRGHGRHRFLREAKGRASRRPALDERQGVYRIPRPPARTPEDPALPRRGARKDRSNLAKGLELADLLARDDEPLDLRGALPDLEDFRVPHPLLHRLVLHVAGAAKDLHRVRRDLHRHVRGQELRDAL